MRRSGYILLLILLGVCLLSACKQEKRSGVERSQPLTSIPLEAWVGKPHQFPLPANSGLSYQESDPLRTVLFPLPRSTEYGLSYEVQTGAELMTQDQLYFSLNAMERGFKIDGEFYFQDDFDRSAPRPGGGNIEVEYVKLEFVVMDSTGSILFRDDMTKTFTASDSVFLLDFNVDCIHNQLRNFSPGLQTLTLALEGYGYSPYGVKSAGKLIDFQVSFEQDLPPLYLTTIHYEGLKLTDDAYGRHWDEFLANPKPDIYWYLECNGIQEYRSSKHKNAQYHEWSAEFDLYHYHPDEPIQIIVMDGDILFNDDDWIDSWQGKISELVSDEMMQIDMDDLEYFKIRADFKGEYTAKPTTTK